MSGQILLPKVIIGTLLQVKKAMSKLVYEAVMTGHKAEDSSPSATLESLLERVVKKVMNPPETFAHITEAVIEIPGLISRTALFIKFEQRK